MSRGGVYLLVALIVGGGVWYYWTHRQQQGATSASAAQIQQDLAYYQAWQDAQAAANQPSGQNANPQQASNGAIVFGTPVGAGASNIQTQNAAMSLPVNS